MKDKHFLLAPLFWEMVLLTFGLHYVCTQSTHALSLFTIYTLVSSYVYLGIICIGGYLVSTTAINFFQK